MVKLLDQKRESPGRATGATRNNSSDREVTAILAETLDNADDWWADSAWRAMAVLAETGREFTAYDLTEMGVPDPDHPNRWGALFAAAHKQEIITPIGFEQSRRRARHSGVCRIWRGQPKAVGQ